ncbi:MAG TPA: NfeD family protein [Thermoanaerobaculia bacterium]|nr:NfeD family protein [Thermoanaerobaculia bacterium]
MTGLAMTGALLELGTRIGGWLAVAAAVLLVGWLSLHRLAALAARLAIAVSGDEVSSRVHGGREGMVGERGIARTGLDPRGKVFVHGELWTAVAEAPVAPAQPVEVVDVEGLTLRVRPITQHAEPRVRG